MEAGKLVEAPLKFEIDRIDWQHNWPEMSVTQFTLRVHEPGQPLSEAWHGATNRSTSSASR